MIDKPVAIITGASQGIGAATAREFAARGYVTALVARNAANLESVAQEVSTAGGEALVCSGDLSDLEFAEAAVERTFAHWGRIDVLVNNAAWRDLTTMRDISLDSWERTMRVCVTAPAFLARWAAVHMEQARRGVIINISSIMSEQISGISPAYVAAKGALDSLTFELAVLYGPSGVRVVGLNFGAIDTEMSNDYETADGENVSAEWRRWSEDMIPLQRFGTAGEAAKTIALLASDDASYITATGIVADGGWSHQLSPYSQKRRQFPGQF